MAYASSSAFMASIGFLARLASATQPEGGPHRFFFCPNLFLGANGAPWVDSDSVTPARVGGGIEDASSGSTPAGIGAIGSGGEEIGR